MQELGEAFFCIVDLHSITTAFEPEELRESTYSLAAMLFAVGLDPKRSVVFVQSDVSAHVQAAWLLSSVTAFGELRRMTQFKDKASEQDFVSSGLFTYPVLMAADILLYRTTMVPVGDDQRQHVELVRDVAARFNARFGDIFELPTGVYPETGARIKNLQDPTRLMSTSAGDPSGVLRLTDSPELIRRKVLAAVTDSGNEIRYDIKDKPGISNLIEIMAVVTDCGLRAIEQRYEGVGYGAFKADMAEAVVSRLKPIQDRYRELRSDEHQLLSLLREGAERARRRSEPMLFEMYTRMGFIHADGAMVRT